MSKHLRLESSLKQHGAAFWQLATACDVFSVMMTWVVIMTIAIMIKMGENVVWLQVKTKWDEHKKGANELIYKSNFLKVVDKQN